jgi:CHAD domain-containing protein
MLGRVAARLHAAGRPLEGQGDNGDRIEEIHRLRICGKELRYTMEIAVGAFGQPLRDLYGFIEQAQARLGIINDHAVALDFYQAWDDRESDPDIREAIATVVALERSGLEATLRDFPHWWSDQHVGQFWQRWQDVVGPLPSQSPPDTDDDSRFKKKGA